MNKIANFTSVNGQKIGIIVAKVTGFTEVRVRPDLGHTFIATGADDPDGGENGWYVKEKYGEVHTVMEIHLKD